LLNSVSHQIEAVAPLKFKDYFNFAKLFSWGDLAIDSNGKWIGTIEKVGTRKINSLVIRDLQTINQLKVIDLPTYSVQYIWLDEAKSELIVIGGKEGNQELILLNADNFEIKATLTIYPK
jgi:hypothetical protein